VRGNRRWAAIITVLVVAIAALGAYGIFGRGKTKTKKPTPVAATTTTTRFIVVAVAPEAGAIGTTFNLVGVGFTPGDDVTFVIEFPNGQRYPGQPHVVAQNTTVIATYRATPGNPVGDYTVRATSTRNESVQGKFTVLGPGGATSTSGPAGATGAGATTTATTGGQRFTTTTTTRR
jgi:hypothetical protein